jgi:Flp pilus assembly protein TadG
MLTTHNKVRRGQFRSERGTALAELALVMPLLLVLVLGMIDLGKAFNEWLDEAHLANLGARLAAVNYCPQGALTTDTNGNPSCDWTSTSITDPTLRCSDANPNICLAKYINTYTDLPELKNGRSGSSTYAPNQNAAQVCISYPNLAATQQGDPVRVTVKIRYKWLRYLTNQVGLATTNIEGAATMRLESKPYVAAPLDSESCYPAAPAGT